VAGRWWAFVDHDLAVARHDVVHPSLSHEALQHADVEATVRRPLAGADPTDLLRLQSQKHRELRQPLIQERPAMHQDERAAPAGCDEPGRDHRLSDTWRRDEDPGVVGEEGLRRSLLRRRERAAEPEANVPPRGPLVAELKRGGVLAKEGLELPEAAPRKRDVVREVFRTGDDARDHCRREPEVLLLVELGVLKGRKALDLVDHGRGKASLLDEQPLGEHCADPRWERFGHARSPYPTRRAPSPRLSVVDLRVSQADDRPLSRRLARDPCHHVRVDAADRCEVGPLLVVREGSELVVHEDGVAVPSRFALQRQGNQVAKTAAGQRVLTREEPIVRVQTQLVAPR
jgi:hypothetical protein